METLNYSTSVIVTVAIADRETAGYLFRIRWGDLQAGPTLCTLVAL
jgi:hypothetical protein